MLRYEVVSVYTWESANELEPQPGEILENQWFSLGEAFSMPHSWHATQLVLLFHREQSRAIAEIQAIIDANKREQLGLILLSKNEILHKVIEFGLADETKPRDRLAIFDKLNKIEDDMGQNLRKESESERQAQEILLTGPKTIKAKSTFTHTQTVTIEF